MRNRAGSNPLLSGGNLKFTAHRKRKLMDRSVTIDVKKIELSILFVVLALVSCDRAQQREQITEDYKRRLPTMEQSGIVAGPGERTLEENDGLQISLPMPEKQFLALLDRLKLRYDIENERPGIIPVPFHCHAIDLSRIQKAYRIYGKQFDSVRVLGEVYRAYVDKDGNVVCIENTFVYDGP
jgi:hypothetical protein